MLALVGRAGQTEAMATMAWFVVIVTPLVTGFAFFGVREQAAPAPSHAGGSSAYLRLAARADVRIVLAGELLLGLAAGTTTLALFFFALAKGIAPVDVGIILIGQFVVALCVMPLWTRVARRLDKHGALAIAAVGSGLMQIPLYMMPAGNLPVATAAFAFVGLFYGAIAMLPRAMIADCADVHRLDTGQDSTGSLFALLIGVWKTGQALSVGLLFSILDWIGFQPSLDAINPPIALMRLQWVYCLLPLALSLAAAAMLLRYLLTSACHASVRAALATRHEH